MTVLFFSWVQIAAGGYAGRKLALRAGSVPGTEYSREGHFLPAGKYYLQVVYRYWFATEPPLMGDGARIAPEALGRWQRAGIKLDLFRSNILEVELADL